MNNLSLPSSLVAFLGLVAQPVFGQQLPTSTAPAARCGAVSNILVIQVIPCDEPTVEAPVENAGQTVPNDFFENFDWTPPQPRLRAAVGPAESREAVG